MGLWSVDTLFMYICPRVKKKFVSADLFNAYQQLDVSCNQKHTVRVDIKAGIVAVKSKEEEKSPILQARSVA